MLEGFRLLDRAINVLFREPKRTFSTILPGVSIFAIGMIFFYVAAAFSENPDSIFATKSMVWGSLIILYASNIFGYAWMAIAWHRSILLPDAERHREIQPSLGIFGSYIFRWLILVLTIVPFYIIILVGIRFSRLEDVFPILSIIAIVLLFPVTLIILTRLSLVLPAIAIGKPIRLKESWLATRGKTVAIAIATGSLYIFGQFAGRIGEFFQSDLLVPLLVDLLVVLISVSVLTTLYSICIKEREVD